MILEVADIRIEPGRQAEFDAVIAKALAEVVSQAEGYRGHRVQRGVESPERYLLMIWWDRLESHTVGFRQSERFVAWRATVGPFFATPPHVEHFELVDATGADPSPAR
ncbi:antibiotic biosynthesis monooxygenase family protein [Piscinibacter koreensis]|uniref:Antibiotic biosynthesis monooxygenase n=1 Tax=Piscinibacter koreensis TaxID=2742824 RepID=A0A7Y6NKJ5_9BURK|nr:antibiotic biosynthesis monooxygenase [Schlegelella koreensis]NUZ04809.1 antibiotic biosynthesis monooxygenase [Schlegelella koreensis]